MQQAPGGCAHLARTRRRRRWWGVVWRGCGTLRHMPGSGAGGMNSRTRKAIRSHTRRWRDIPAQPDSVFWLPVHANPRPSGCAGPELPLRAGDLRGPCPLLAPVVRGGSGRSWVGSRSQCGVGPWGSGFHGASPGRGVRGRGLYSGVHRSAGRGWVIHGFVLWRDCVAAGDVRGAEVLVPGVWWRWEAWSRAHRPVPVPRKTQSATRDSGLTPPA